MKTLPLEPGQSIDAAWADRARALSPSERERLLARADELRESNDGAAVALECYRALCDELNARRLTWLLQRSRGADPGLEDVVRLAADATPGEELWIYGQFRLAEYERVHGQVDDAIARLFEVLRRVEGNDDTAEGLVAANLAICLRQQERTIESFVTARRAVAALAKTSRLRTLLHVKHVLAMLYAAFHDWQRHERIVADLESGLAALPPEDRERLERVSLRTRVASAIERGDFEKGLEDLVRLERAYPERRATVAAMRAYVLTRLGRADEARPIVEDLKTVGRPVPWLAVRIETADTLCSIALDGSRKARERVEAFLKRLSSTEFDSPGVRAKMLVHVARALRDVPDLAPLAKRVYGQAAQCYVRRLAEVERFTRAQQPPVELGPDERRVLGELRARLIESHRELMKPIASLLDEARRRGDAMPADWYDEQGVLPVCAWCACVRHRDGTWIPVGTLIPGDRRLRLTHGMCPACRQTTLDRRN